MQEIAKLPLSKVRTRQLARHGYTPVRAFSKFTITLAHKYIALALHDHEKAVAFVPLLDYDFAFLIRRNNCPGNKAILFEAKVAHSDGNKAHRTVQSIIPERLWIDGRRGLHMPCQVSGHLFVANPQQRRSSCRHSHHVAVRVGIFHCLGDGVLRWLRASVRMCSSRFSSPHLL